MMVIDIRERGDEHLAFERLLPWYVTGRLAADEVARAEAHLATCAACREQLSAERALRDAVVASSVEPDAAWSELRRRMRSEAPGGPVARARRAVSAALARPGRLIGFAAAQAAVVLLVVAVARPPAPATSYTVLSAAPAAVTGNIVIVFKPETTEERLRDTLNAAGAAIVDGPTPADAYLLRVPAAGRDAALAALRAAPHVVTAEPIDAEARP